MVKDPSLIVSDETTGSERLLVIKRNNPSAHNHDTKLGDVLELLPSGMISKEETGIGATTLELGAKHNSIIVEPIKITASSKAHKHNALYVGSETKYHPYKTLKQQIAQYLSKDTIEFKKIIVVADSLERVTWVVREYKMDFFLLIDEIDSFQLDSFYREKMEDCINIYKAFPREKRSMVSATTMAFSDPDLKNEPKTIIRYDQPTRRTIQLVYTPQKVASAAVKKIAELQKEKAEDKLLIAYNSVKGCYNIARHLCKNHRIAEADIKILCSSSNKEKIGAFYSELESDKLPSRINFITSAYFTGFDLHERYHLISVSGNINKIHSLSDKRLKQIAGRCRDKKGLLSETIIYDTVPLSTKEENYSLTDIIDSAEHEIAALKCIEQHYLKHPLLKGTIDSIRKLVAQHTTSNGYRFVNASRSKPTISYLNIDAFMEALRVRNELYRDKRTLPKVLQEAGHFITVTSINSTEEIENNDIEKEARGEQIRIILDKLRALPKIISAWQLVASGIEKYTTLQKDIIYKLIELHRYIDRDKLFELIQEAGEQRDKRKLNNLFLAAYYLTLDPRSHYKRLVTFHIPIGEVFTGEVLLEKWNTIFLESGLLRKLDSVTQAVRLTKLHYKIQRKRGTDVGQLIKDENPFGLLRLQYRPYQENQKESYHSSFWEDLSQHSTDIVKEVE